MKNTSDGRRTLPPLELLRIVPLSEAARLRGVNTKLLREQDRDKIVKRGNGSFGMRLGDALRLLDEPATGT